MLWSKAAGAGGTLGVGPVTDGLVLYLDAANPDSYPGSGDTWFDLSPSGINLGMVGTPSWNSSGYFSTGSGSYFQETNADWSLSIPTGDAPRTVCAVASRSPGSVLEHIVHYGQDVTNAAYALAVRTTTARLSDHRWVGENLGPVVPTGENMFVSTRYHTTTYPGARFQLNDTFSTSTDATSNLNTGTDDFHVGARVNGPGSPAEEWYGTIGAVLIYDRALTDEELLQNYAYFQNRLG
jgi:hypothetical protein